MFTLRIDSGVGYGGGYRATLYGPGLPVVEPALDMNVVNLDLRRAMREARKMMYGSGSVPDHVFGLPEGREL
jgi:hypothetical protein